MMNWCGNINNAMQFKYFYIIRKSKGEALIMKLVCDKIIQNLCTHKKANADIKGGSGVQRPTLFFHLVWLIFIRLILSCFFIKHFLSFSNWKI